MPRRKPAFEPDSYESQHPPEKSPGCFFLLILTVIGYLIFSALSRTTLSGFTNASDRYICYGTLLGLVILFSLAKWQAKRDKHKLEQARQEWKRTGKSAEVAILNRRDYPGGSYEDEYGIPHTSRPAYHLELEPGPDQRTANPQSSLVHVDLKPSVYHQLLDRKTVKIYYQPEAPFTFLLEEEI